MATIDISEIPFDELSPDYVEKFSYNYIEASSITTYAYSGILKTTNKNILETILMSEFPREAASNCIQLFYKELDELYYQSMDEALTKKFSDEKLLKQLLQTQPNTLAIEGSVEIGEYLTFFRNKLVEELKQKEMKEMYESFAVYNFLEGLIINGLDNLESFVNKPVSLIVQENKLKVVYGEINDEIKNIYKISSIPSYLRKKFIRKYNNELKKNTNSYILNSYIDSLSKNENLYKNFSKTKLSKSEIQNIVKNGLISSINEEEKIALEKRLYSLYECGVIGKKNMKKILSEEEVNAIENIKIDEKVLHDQSIVSDVNVLTIDKNNILSPFNTYAPISLKGFVFPNVMYYIRFCMLQRVGMQSQESHNFLMKYPGKSYDINTYKSDEKIIEETQKIRQDYLRKIIKQRASEVFFTKFKHMYTKQLLVSTYNSKIVYSDDSFLSNENFFGEKLMELRQKYIRKNIQPLENIPDRFMTLNEFFKNNEELDWIEVKLKEVLFVLKKFKEYLKIKVNDDSNVIHEKEADFIVGLYSSCLPVSNEKIPPIPVDFVTDKDISKQARKVLWKYVFSIHQSLKKLIGVKNMKKFSTQIKLLEEKFKTISLETRDLFLFPEDPEDPDEFKETKNLIATAFLCLFEKITKFPFGITKPLEIEEADISLVHSILTYNYNTGINIIKNYGENELAVTRIISTYNHVPSVKLVSILLDSFNTLLTQNTIKQRSYMFSQLCKNVDVGKRKIWYQESGKISFVPQETLDYDISRVIAHHKKIKQNDEDFNEKILQYQKEFDLESNEKIDEFVKEIQEKNEKQKNVMKFVETTDTIYIPNKNYIELDQDFECNVLYKNMDFKSVDHAFQASKFLYKDAPDSNMVYVKIIQNAQTAGLAKKFGNFSKRGYSWLGEESLKEMNDLIDEYETRVEIRPDWEEKQEAIMKNILQSKFSLNQNCKQALLKTYTKNIVYLSKTDKVFGTNKDNDGENLLGKILEEIREENRLV